METEGKKRSGCLIAFLLFMMWGSLAQIYKYLHFSAQLRQKYPTLPIWSFPILSLLNGLLFIAAIGMWNWKKWGVILFAFVALLGGIVTFLMGTPLFVPLISVVELLFLFFFFRPIWSDFE